jgi:hypothetical protein
VTQAILKHRWGCIAGLTWKERNVAVDGKGCDMILVVIMMMIMMMMMMMMMME